MRTRTVHRGGAVWMDILKGVLLAIAVTAALVAAFALVISLFDLSDGVIRTVNQALKLLAVYVGVRAAVQPGSERGLLRGAAVGAVYMAAGVMVYALLTAQGLTPFAYAADVLMGVAAGGLIGLLRARRSG